MRLGYFTPLEPRSDALGPGEVGFVVAGIKTVADMRVGDTVTDADASGGRSRWPASRNSSRWCSPGSTRPRPTSTARLRDAIEKLRLNDASLIFEPETSQALGFGFRAGFLGLLHMEIAQERLEREFGLDLIITAPTVAYRVRTTDGRRSPDGRQSRAAAATRTTIEAIEEPFILASIHVPEEFLGAVMKLCEEKRGVQRDLRYCRTAAA